MLSEDVVKKLKAIVMDKLGADEAEIVPEADFIQDLNADSLDLVDLIMEIEDKFEIQIPDEDAEKIKTVGDAMAYLEEHLK